MKIYICNLMENKLLKNYFLLLEFCVDFNIQLCIFIILKFFIIIIDFIVFVLRFQVFEGGYYNILDLFYFNMKFNIIYIWDLLKVCVWLR